MDNPACGTLWDMIASTAQKHAQRPALLFPEHNLEWNYQQFYEQGLRAAGALMAAGFKRGDHVALWSVNSPWLLAVQAGALAAGIPLILLNTDFRSMELEFALQLTEARALIMSASNGGNNDFLSAISSLCPELRDKNPGELQCQRLPLLKQVIGLEGAYLPGITSWQELLEQASSVDEADLMRRISETRPEDTAWLLFTSGTTGDPKGAMVSHHNVESNTRAAAAYMGFQAEDRLALPLPLFHAYGLGMLMDAFLVGASCVIFGQFNPQLILKGVLDAKASILCGTPTMFVGWLEASRQGQYGISCLKKAISAGSSLYTSTANRLITELNLQEVWNILGTTETFLVCGHRVAEVQNDETIPVGSVLPGIEVRVIAAGEPSSEEMPPGRDGELLVRSSGVMQGYYRNPEATARAIDPEGWYHCGDMASVDSSGLIRISGRLKEVLIRGGENLFPREIEEYIMSHPSVQEAQVVGIPSEYFGEEPVAFIILKDGASLSQLELKRYCRERIAYYKVPVYVFTVDSFPKTASGKIQKFRLKEQALQLLEEKRSGN